VPASLSEKQLADFRRTALDPEGLELLRFLRGLSDGVLQEGSGALADRGAELGWLDAGATSSSSSPRAPRPPRLTDLGWVISDTAREYCNWIDDGRRLSTEGLPELAGKSVLDVGCGWGRYVICLSQLGARACGIDASSEHLQLGRVLGEIEGQPASPLVSGSSHSLPFAQGSFDVVLCIRAFAYMDLEAALREFGRVLRPGGQLVICTPVLERLLRDWVRDPGGFVSLATLRMRARWLAIAMAVTLVGRRPRYFPPAIRNPAYLPLRSVLALAKRCGLRPAASVPRPRFAGNEAWMTFESL